MDKRIGESAIPPDRPRAARMKERRPMLCHRALFNTTQTVVNTRRTDRLLARLPVALFLAVLLSVGAACSDAPDEGIPREPFSESVDP